MNKHPAQIVRAGLMMVVMMGLLAGRAMADARPEVRDGAHLLAPATVDRVNDIVKQIRQKSGKDLTIATFSGIPENMKPGFSAENKEQFYEDWLRREAIKAGTNGVFVLIVTDPYHLQIGVGKTTSPHIFTNSDRDELRDLMLKSLHERRFDDAAVDGATFVLERMQRNQSDASDKSPAVATTEPSAPATQPVQAKPTTEPVSEIPPAPPTEHSSARYEKTMPATRGAEFNK